MPAAVWRFGGRESIFLFSHTNEFCGKSKVAHEPELASPALKAARQVYERTTATRRGSAANPRVGKIKKVVKRRGVCHASLVGEKNSRQGLPCRRRRVCGGAGGVCGSRVAPYQSRVGESGVAVCIIRDLGLG